MSPLGYVLVAIVALPILVIWRRRRRVRAILGLAEAYDKLVHDLELLVRLKETGMSPKEIIAVFLGEQTLDGTAVVQMDYQYLRRLSSNTSAVFFGLEYKLRETVDNTYTELVIAIGVYAPEGNLTFRGVTIAPPPRNEHS